MFTSTQKKGARGRSTSLPGALFTFVALMSLLSACVTPDNPHQRNPADNFGNAVRQNIAAQVINPEAAGPDESDRIDGQTAERALEGQRTRSADSDPESLIISAGGGN